MGENVAKGDVKLIQLPKKMDGRCEESRAEADEGGNSTKGDLVSFDARSSAVAHAKKDARLKAMKKRFKQALKVDKPKKSRKKNTVVCLLRLCAYVPDLFLRVLFGNMAGAPTRNCVEFSQESSRSRSGPR